MKDKYPNQHDPIKNLSPELMESYVNGSLSPELMMQVEKFIEDNPFEKEAVEGLRGHSVRLTSEMAELEAQLSKAVRKEKANLLQYWPMAAAISLLIISGVVFYLVSPLSSEQKQVVQLSVEDEPQSIDEPVLSEKSPLTDAPTEPETGNNQEEKTPGAAVSSKEQENRDLAHNINPKNEPVTQEKVDHPPDPLVNHNIEEDRNEEESSNEEPLPSAGRSQSLNSAAPTASSSASRKKSGPVTDIPMATAPSNWSEYLNKYLIYPESARINRIQGSVKLAFQVNTDGSVFGIEVINKLGYGCDQEAIRILSEGPPWKPAIIGGNLVISQVEIEIEFSPDL